MLHRLGDRSQSSLGEGHGHITTGHLKKKNEIRTSALSNSSMEMSWKRKKGGEKEGNVRTGNTSELNVRSFVTVFLIADSGWSIVRTQPS